MSASGTERRGPDIPRSAAVGATVLVALMQTYHTVGTDRTVVWLDAVANEWIIWFTLLYLALTGGAAVRERLVTLNRYRRSSFK